MSEFKSSAALLTQAKYAREMAGLTNDREAALWQQIADEIDSYLEEPAPAQEDLFEDLPRSDGYCCEDCRAKERE